MQRCPNHHFAVPLEKIPEYNYTKTGHACKLIAEGRNIASTHAALKYYTHDMLEQIQTTGYTLIIDENLSAMRNLLIKWIADVEEQYRQRYGSDTLLAEAC